MMLALRTIRHLRWRQLAEQVRMRLMRRLADPAALARRPATPWPGLRWSPRGAFLPPGSQDAPGNDPSTGRLTFVSDTRDVGAPPDWDIDAPKLWQYNLHYFEYLWDLSFDDARTLAEDWIDRHTPEIGRVGWEPYPTSLRLVNWTAFFFGRRREDTLADEAFRDRLFASIVRQADWLSRNIERHLMGNHLFENGVALALVGAAFEGPDARRFRRIGQGILEREIPEQTLADGGHFERSPMYHCRILYGLLALANTGDDALDALCREPAARMAAALANMTHPDGRIALFNDSAFGIYNPPTELIDYARTLGVTDRDTANNDAGHFALPQTGYFGARDDAGTFFIIDAGPVGPDYIPGHAHGDIFSFELSWKGRRVVVDSGCFSYLPGEMRDYCRSTRAHNTVEVGGADQCEFWGTFRVARRGRPRDVRFERRDDGFVLEGRHDGYRRLPGAPVHRRRAVWREAGVLMVRDRVTSGRPVRWVSRLHLHPDCRAEREGDDAVRIETDRVALRVRFAGPGELSIGRSWYCPRFGQRMENTVIEFASAGRGEESAFCVAESRQEIALDVQEGAVVDGLAYTW